MDVKKWHEERKKKATLSVELNNNNRYEELKNDYEDAYSVLEEEEGSVSLFDSMDSMAENKEEIDEDGSNESYSVEINSNQRFDAESAGVEQKDAMISKYYKKYPERNAGVFQHMHVLETEIKDRQIEIEETMN